MNKKYDCIAGYIWIILERLGKVKAIWSRCGKGVSFTLFIQIHSNLSTPLYKQYKWKNADRFYK